jgi:anthranilate phosphoribosyltransferase
MSFVSFLHRVMARENLSAADAEEAMSIVLEGEATTAQLAAFLAALKMKGETADEIYGFARAMRSKVLRVDPQLEDQLLIDTCGTGGDGLSTFNISTIAAFVVAGAGVHVAKHGNRSITSHCGSADVLEALGVKINLKPEQIAYCIRECGIGFLFAPGLHPAMAHAQAARLELKTRTAFNLLGPLTNPAGAQAQLIGAPSAETAGLMALALARLGLVHGFVVHGKDGLDEISTTGPTLMYEVQGSHVSRKEVHPRDFGVPQSKPEDLKGESLEHNCEIARSVLGGAPGPRRDIVMVNASAALVAAGKAADFTEGMRLAADSIDSEAAARKLARLAVISQEF